MIIEKIFNSSKNHPEKQAIVFQGKSISYKQLQNEILKRGNIFKCHISNKIIILSKSDNYENLIDFLAIISIGKVGIFSSNQIQKENLIQLKEKTDAFILEDSFENLSNNYYDNSGIFKPNINDLFLGVLSSGTETTPKIIWKDYQSWVSAFPHQSQVFGINENDRLFVIDALSYSANLNSALHILWQGGTVVLTTLKSASTWAKQMEENQISSVFMVPSHYRLLLKNDCKLLNIKSLVSAGEKLDYKTARGLIQNFSNANLTEYYGAAELGHISFHQNQDILDFGYSVGKAFPDVKIEIKEQKIMVESPYISPDFRDIKTVFDIGYFEKDKIVILGRAGRMFNKRGLNVFAEEIENKVQEIDFVEEVAAVGKLRNDGSHDIFVAFSAFSEISQENIKIVRKYLLEKLPSAKQPKKILQLRNLPHKDIGKIDFHAVARLFVEEDSNK